MWLSLGLLDFLMDKTSSPFYTQIATKEFMQLLITMLNTKDAPQEVSLCNKDFKC
jgi:hypothetical protein